MSSGFDCDDWAETPRPGSEDVVTGRRGGGPGLLPPHLQLPMEFAPGTDAT